MNKYTNSLEDKIKALYNMLKEKDTVCHVCDHIKKSIKCNTNDNIAYCKKLNMDITKLLVNDIVISDCKYYNNIFEQESDIIQPLDERLDELFEYHYMTVRPAFNIETQWLNRSVQEQIKYNAECNVWYDIKERKHRISEMDIDYVINIIKFLKRKNIKVPKEFINRIGE